MDSIRRIFVEKKKEYNVEGQHLLEDFKHNLSINALDNVRILNRYDVDNISNEAYTKALHTIFSEPPVDIVYEEEALFDDDEVVFGMEYLPGQYDQRADSCEQCIQILNADERPIVKVAKVIVLKGDLTSEEIDKIKKHCINPVDQREASLEKPRTLELEFEIPDTIEILEGFIELDDEGIKKIWSELSLAMTVSDLLFTQKYFKEEEKRNPTLTEIRVLDTYWSDHCRHTTFSTKINEVTFDDGHFNTPVKDTYEKYLLDRGEVLGEKADSKDVCLMDLALLAMRKLRKEGKLDDLEVSDEINACSIIVEVEEDTETREWLVMFKNETHNHPTEIEPFGGAATCLGGAIRDPLSGRSYVYQAMRVTGAADPTKPIQETLEGKLSQRKIVTESAHGYSSYGNQIGLATGKVDEIYHPNYVAKRMEIGAVIAAAPRENVVRKTSDEGNIIVLLGGRTGRDGCGGATGSSKEHTLDSIHTCSAEVQKGNPPTERKIQRLFRRQEVSRLIKKCNDFGAGGVSVAIGELADGLIIDLDLVPKKYMGLDGTELAISESQERMAVVLDKKDVEQFITYSEEENLEATVVATVTKEKRLIMNWKGNKIVDINREFLDTNGATVETDIHVLKPADKSYFKEKFEEATEGTFKSKFMENIANLNICSKKGLVERFDSSIGAGSVLMPYGGKYQLTPTEVMVAKIPVEQGDTKTGTMMSYGYNPYLASWSPYHGAVYAVVDSVAKVVAAGGDYSKIRFTFQEYFKRLNEDKERWGEPLSALLGAYHAQTMLDLPSIGGKDSMSGTFRDIDVPPTLVSFAVDVVNVEQVISPEFKKVGSSVVCIPLARDEYELPDFEMLKRHYTTIHKLIKESKILAAHTVGMGGISETISKMCFGNMIGFNINQELCQQDLFVADYGAIILEIDESLEVDTLLKEVVYFEVGQTVKEAVISYGVNLIELDDVLVTWEKTLEPVFATKAKGQEGEVIDREYHSQDIYICKNKVAKPKVFIPVFPGTNCEYDSKKAFENAGAEVKTFVLKNLLPEHVEESIDFMARQIDDSQIVMIPGGFSAGDEPEGSGKFIATVFRNEKIKASVMNLLNNRDGLMLGICNGFQALIKLGLLPQGKIIDLEQQAPTLTYNTIGRHVSCMVNTKIMSNKSPWLANVNVSDVFTIPVSHGEGRFVASQEVVQHLFENGQVASCYVDLNNNPSMDIRYNPNGSVFAIEGITSLDGRILGKMGHSERVGSNVSQNVPGVKDQMLFKSGVEYFTK
jgi:phosphoribosylformylglycinamidine synthase